MERNYVWVGQQAFCLSLQLEAPDCGRRDKVSMQSLNRDELVQNQVAGFVDDAHASFADSFKKFVVNKSGVKIQASIQLGAIARADGN
jgi:hypothetical protein